MQQTKTDAWPAIESSKLEVLLTRDEALIEAAQRLRYDIFAREMGANITNHNGRDIDRYDAFCRHLLVRDKTSGDIVGAYRLTTIDAAEANGGWYSASEFDLSRLENILPKCVELGRACVHKDYRSGSTISLLWMGLTQFMKLNSRDYMIGCGSMSMADGGHEAASLFRHIQQHHYAPEEYRVFPIRPLPLDQLQQDLPVTPPALLKGYLRAGVWICGEPHWDQDFNTADMLVMMPMWRINPRYAKHFVR